MNCPFDAATLHVAERHGIEIDYCPSCRGVWLDRGELDKIILRAAEGVSRGWRDRFADHDGYLPRHSGGDGHDRGNRSKKKKRSSFLSELFEVGE